MPIGKKVWCLTHGFFSKNYVLYNLHSNNYKDYITDFQENFRANRINKFSALFNNKLAFTELVKSRLKMPKVKGLIQDGKFVRYGSHSCENLSQLLDYIKVKGVILKPIEGDGGEGIYLAKYENGKFYWNQTLSSIEEIKEKILRLNYYFISDLVHQHQYSNEIFSKSINTIRILTMIDPYSNDSIIAAAAHRIGNNNSLPVDNCAKGGFTAKIDVETGVLGKAVATYYKGDTPTWYGHHPDSGASIEGIQIPNWKEIIDQIKVLSNELSFMKYVGWDIVLQPDGTITLLEANDGADLKLHQVHEPLLVNSSVVNFYKYYKVVG